MIDLLQVIGWTLVPALELRASIPFGIMVLNMNWLTVFFVALITNIILGVFVFILLEWIIKVLTAIPFINKLWQKYVDKTQAKIEKGVEKYGEWAIAVFIGIPLPGSGVYTGAVAAFLIGLDEKKFFIANIIGVLIAAVVVTIVSLTLDGASSIFIKQI